MSSEEQLIVLPDQPPPSSARHVSDLFEWIGDNQKVTFRGHQKPDGAEPSFLCVSTMGGYINNGLPKIEGLKRGDALPTPQKRNRAHTPLSCSGEINVRFTGDPDWMADLYKLSTTLYLVSEQVYELIQELDNAAIEATKATMIGKHALAMKTYWVVMPCRVLDAIDISKSDVLVRRGEVGNGRFVTHVNYLPGHKFKADVPPDACCFMDEFKSVWYWRQSLIEAAAKRGVRGLLFGHGQVRHAAEEIRLRGPNDPLTW